MSAKRQCQAMGGAGVRPEKPEDDENLRHFITWWHGTADTGNMDDEDQPKYFTEKPIVSNDIKEVKKSCPSLTAISITSIKRYTIHANTYFVGRLSDGRFLVVVSNYQEMKSAIAISPRCGPPIDSMCRNESVHCADIARTLEALDHPTKPETLVAGCIALKVDSFLEHLGEVVRALGM
jgi:hypothetical protein